MKHKIRFWLRMIHEMLETMVTICLYLEEESHRLGKTRYSPHLRSHANELKGFSERLREEHPDVFTETVTFSTDHKRYF